MECNKTSITDCFPKPLAVGWVGGKNRRNSGITINFTRRFNWVQRWGIRTFLGIEIKNVKEASHASD